MATIGNIIVEVGANTAKLKSALTKAHGSLKKWASKAGDIIKSAAKAFAAFGAAGIAAIGAIVTKTASSIQRIDQMSRAFGVSSQVMQEWGYMAERLGFDTAKMGDIFKDVNDKIGDFLDNDTGPFADAIKILNLNAQEFKDISPDQAIAKLADEMDRMGVSTQQANFIWESLASDLALFDPLLRKNQAGLKRIAQEARDAGIVLSDADKNGVLKFKNSLDKLWGIIKGFGYQLTAELAPAMDEILSRFVSWIEKSGGVKKIAVEMAQAIIQGVIAGVQAVAEFIKNLNQLMVKLIDMKAFWIAFKGVFVDTADEIGRKLEMLSREREKYLFGGIDTSKSEAFLGDLLTGLQTSAASAQAPAAAAAAVNGAISSQAMGTVTLKTYDGDFVELNGTRYQGQALIDFFKRLQQDEMQNTARISAGG